MREFRLSLYTPAGTIVKDLTCNEAYIPTCRGELNILPEHTHILTSLSTGILTAKTNAGERHFSITAGVLKVLGDEIIVLSTTSEDAGVIDIERAKSAEAKAQSRLASEEAMTDVHMIKFQRKLERARMRIKLGNLR
jgi:F-type H+-transporting ATPase subunit epsilon